MNVLFSVRYTGKNLNTRYSIAMKLEEKLWGIVGFIWMCQVEQKLCDILLWYVVGSTTSPVPIFTGLF